MIEKKSFGFSSTYLKLIALVAMTIDHIGFIFFPGQEIFRIIGRLAYPIFAFMIAEGCRYTKHRFRHLGMVAGLGVICSIVYYIFDQSLYQCILITFTLSILTIMPVWYVKKHWRNPRMCTTGILWLTAMIIVDLILGMPIPALKQSGWSVDYAVFGILTPVLVYAVPNYRFAKIYALTLGLVCLAITAPMGGLQWWGLLSVPIIAFYNGKKSKYTLKYLFYIYYPLHLVVLEGIAMLIKGTF